MAFFNKLSNVANKAKEAATKAVAAAAEMAEQAKAKMEQEQMVGRQTAPADAVSDEEAKRQKRLAMRDRILDGDPYNEEGTFYEDATDEEIEELAHLTTLKKNEKSKKLYDEEIKKFTQGTNCDKGQGDCCWMGDYFYCTCSDDTPCPRKTFVTAAQFGELDSPEHLPLAKLLATYYDDGELSFEKEDSELDFNGAVRGFFMNYLPEQCDADQFPLGESISAFGIGRENPIMDIVFSIHQQTGGKTVVPIRDLDILYTERDINVRQPFFKNPSLYDRSRDDFLYTVHILDTVSNPNKLRAYFSDTSGIDINLLFNSDGTIKPAGYGGAKKGHYGDVIYNVVLCWKEMNSAAIPGTNLNDCPLMGLVSSSVAELRGMISSYIEENYGF